MHFNVIGPDLREYELIDEATLRRWLRQRRLDLASPAKEFGDTSWRTVADFPDCLEEPPPPIPEVASPPPVPGAPPTISMGKGVPVIPPLVFEKPPPSFLLPSILASLLNTAKLNGLDPYAYLNDVVEQIVSGRVRIHELDQLLAWNWKPASGAMDLAVAA